MKVSFRRGKEKVSFTAHPRKKKCPKHLKKFWFKPRSKKLASALTKARKKLRTMGWKF
jgi:hypothetical protein